MKDIITLGTLLKEALNKIPSSGAIIITKKEDDIEFSLIPSLHKITLPPNTPIGEWILEENDYALIHSPPTNHKGDEHNEEKK